MVDDKYQRGNMANRNGLKISVERVMKSIKGVIKVNRNGLNKRQGGDLDSSNGDGDCYNIPKL